MVYIWRSLFFAAFCLLAAPDAQAQIQLRTCKVGNVIYTEDSRGTKCIPALTPRDINLLIAAIKATTPQPPNPELRRNENFCSIYEERNDIPNQITYCQAASKLGSMTATDKMCELFVMRDPKSSEALNYCSKSSDADRLTGHAGMFSIKAAAGDYQSAVRYLYRGIDRSFIYNHNPSKLDHQFAAPSSSGRKKITETYLKFAGENLYGASLESLGFPEVQIAPLMKSRRYPSGTIVNDWMGLVKTAPLMYISAPQKVSFTIFIVPKESGSVTGMTGEATPLYCYLKDEEGNFLKGSQYDAACGYLAIYNDFFAAVDVNGRYAPAFVYGQAEIRTDFVAVLD